MTNYYRNISLSLFLICLVSSLLFVSCGDANELGAIDPCEICINGECINNTCACDQFWTGTQCDTVMFPDKIVITGLFTPQIEHEGPVGPWDTANGEEAPDLVYYVYDGVFWDRSQFQGLSYLYRSEVYENWTNDEFNVTDIRIELEWDEPKTYTVALMDNDHPGTAYASNFMELAYIELPSEYDTIPPFRTDDWAIGTLQKPFNIAVTLEHE